MNIMIEEFEKWLLAQEKPPVKGGMTLGKLNEYRTHVCRHAFEGGFNAGQSLLLQGNPEAWMYINNDGECEEISHKSFYKEPNSYMLDIGFTPLYTAPPPTEAFQKELDKLTEDKAELIEYTNKLIGHIDAVRYGELSGIQKDNESEYVLAFPKPMCMQEK